MELIYILLSTSSEHIYNALLVIFIIIFLATATLTICALPGWIKIPDTYLKVLFSSLLLEVVACVFMFFNATGGFTTKLEWDINDEDNGQWVMINEKGMIKQLPLKDSSSVMKIDDFSNAAPHNALYTLTKKDVNSVGAYCIKNDSSVYIGQLCIKNLKKLFDTTTFLKEEVISVKYHKNENEKWSIKKDNEKKAIKKWNLEINVLDSGYEIFDIGIPDTSIFKGSGEATNYNLPTRTIHSFLGSDGAFYVIHISNARTSNKEKPNSDDEDEESHRGKGKFIEFEITQVQIESKLD